MTSFVLKMALHFTDGTIHMGAIPGQSPWTQVVMSYVHLTVRQQLGPSLTYKYGNSTFLINYDRSNIYLKRFKVKFIYFLSIFSPLDM